MTPKLPSPSLPRPYTVVQEASAPPISDPPFPPFAEAIPRVSSPPIYAAPGISTPLQVSTPPPALPSNVFPSDRIYRAHSQTIVMPQMPPPSPPLPYTVTSEPFEYPEPLVPETIFRPPSPPRPHTVTHESPAGYPVPLVHDVPHRLPADVAPRPPSPYSQTAPHTAHGQTSTPPSPVFSSLILEDPSLEP